MDWITIIFVVLGDIARTVLPFLAEVRDDPNTRFDRKFWIPLIIALIINLLALPLILGTISVVSSAASTPTAIPWWMAFGYGWGVTDMANKATKKRNGQNGQPDNPIST